MDHHIEHQITPEQLYMRDIHVRIDGKPLPYEIRFDPEVGRHLVAARDIAAGEILFREHPLTFGPSDNTRPVCLHCYRTLSRHSQVACPRCEFPMCSEQCANADGEHRRLECGLFQENGFSVDADKFQYDCDGDGDGAGPNAYGVVSVARALLLRDADPATWAMLWAHMSHDNKRRKSNFWRARTQKVIAALKSAIGLKGDDICVVEIVLGILLVNDFEIGVDDRDEVDAASIRGLFALASIPSHSCVANTKHTFANKQDGFCMTVRATVPIRSGEDITHTYAEPLDSQLRRRSLLSVGKFFLCLCPRCAQPDELKTFSSALVCPECGRGSVLTTDVHVLEAKWRCDGKECAYEMEAEHVEDVVKDIRKEGDKLDNITQSDPRIVIEAFEGFIRRNESILHRNHVVLVDKKYHLAKMYGRLKGYEPEHLSDQQLKRKRILCEEVLAVLDVILAGRTRKRGIMLYELHLPLMLLSQRSLQRGRPSPERAEAIKKDLKLSLSCLRSALEILSDEPADSFEHAIVEASKDAVAQLLQFTTSVCKTLK